MSSYRKISHIHYICRASLLQEFSYLWLRQIYNRKISYIYYFVGLLPRVCSLVFDEVWLLEEGFSSFLTFIRFLPCFLWYWGLNSYRRISHIHYIYRASPLYVFFGVQLGLVYGERFSDIHYIHKVSLLNCVLMMSEVWLHRKGFTIFITYMGFLSCVISLMNIKKWLHIGWLFTFITFKGLLTSVSSLVYN